MLFSVFDPCLLCCLSSACGACFVFVFPCVCARSCTEEQRHSAARAGCIAQTRKRIAHSNRREGGQAMSVGTLPCPRSGALSRPSPLSSLPLSALPSQQLQQSTRIVNTVERTGAYHDPRRLVMALLSVMLHSAGASAQMAASDASPLFGILHEFLFLPALI